MKKFMIMMLAVLFLGIALYAKADTDAPKSYQQFYSVKCEIDGQILIAQYVADKEQNLTFQKKFCEDFARRYYHQD